MSPFLETWYSQTTCKHCGEPIMFENKIPLESDGTDHRFQCPHYLKHKRKIGAFPEAIPEKPTNPRRALEHEVQYEGQKSMEDWY